MDLGNKTLNGILQAIADENNLVGYNTYRNKRGRIVVKISYEEPAESDQNLDNNSEFDSNRVSLKRMSVNQSKRNFHRAKRFRHPTGFNHQNASVEVPRNSEENSFSASTPNVLDVSTCIQDPDPRLPESPVSHEINSDLDQSCEEPFHDVPDSPTCVTPDLAGSNSEKQQHDSSNHIPYFLLEKENFVYNPLCHTYDKKKYKTPWEHADQPCDNQNCSFGPTPDKIDYSVVDTNHVIKKCPHCDLVVCVLCRKYRGIHRQYFINPPPWD